MILLPSIPSRADVDGTAINLDANISGVAADEDGTVIALTVYSNDAGIPHKALQITDGTSRTGFVTLPGNPTRLGYDPVRNRAYISDLNGLVTAVDVAARAVVGSVSVGGHPFGVDVDPVTGRVFVADNGVYPSNKGQLVVFDGPTMSFLTRVSVPYDPYAVAVAPGGGTAFVSGQDGVITVHQGPGYGVTKTLAVYAPVGVDVSPDGSQLYVATQANKVVAFDTATYTRRESPDLGSRTLDVLLSPDGTRLLATQTDGLRVAILDPASLAYRGVVGGIPGPLFIASAGNTAWVGTGQEGRLVPIIFGPAANPLPVVSATATSLTEGNPLTQEPCFRPPFFEQTCEDRVKRLNATVSLSSPSTEWIELRYTVGAPGSADPNLDYAPFTSSVMIPPGTTTGLAPVLLYADTSAEANETFTLTVTSLVGATLGTPSATITIVDDDAPPPPPDTAGPTVTITSPIAGATLTNGQSILAGYSCADPSGVQSCEGALIHNAASVPLADGSSSTLTDPGGYTLRVDATDNRGNASTNEVTFTVLDPGDLAATVAGGETVSTGATATPSAPLQTSIVVPAGVSGPLSVDAQPASASPTGFELFGQQLVIDGPPATAASPYEVAFTVDNTALAGIAPSDVQVFRNGVLVTGCTSPTQAIPDPCIVSRGFTADASGDALVRVRTSHFSTWTLGRLKYALTGPFNPVKAAPSINRVKGGSTVPVKFQLGGDRGLDVFTAGSPTSTSFACPATNSRETEFDDNEERDDSERGSSEDSKGSEKAASKSPVLRYDAKTGTYTYLWKTTKSMKGCRDLVLTFKDGSVLRTLYRVK